MKRLNFADSRLHASRVRELLAAEGIESTVTDDGHAAKALLVSEVDFAAAEDCRSEN